VGTLLGIYCERTGPALLGEPLNALSNLSFIVASWAAWLLARRSGGPSVGVRALLGLSVSVGIGSGLWHTLATPWAMLLDVLPILFFVLWFVWLYLRSVAGAPTPVAAALVAAFLVAGFFAQQVDGVLNGALSYAPAFAAVLGLGVFHARARPEARFTLLAAAGAYALALVFRTIDPAVCSALPIGTHFLWHSLVGLTAYLAMRAVILSGQGLRQNRKEVRHVRPQLA
jgi:hypothetical protein